jgi:hypothetical protein
VEGALHERLVLAAKGADRIVIRVGIAAKETHGEVFMGEGFDFAARERACGVAEYEQTEHHGRRILRAAGATVVDFGGAEVKQTHRIHHELYDVIGWNSVPEIRRQQHGGVVIHGNETKGHARSLTGAGRVLKCCFLSPTGC